MTRSETYDAGTYGTLIKQRPLNIPQILDSEWGTAFRPVKEEPLAPELPSTPTETGVLDERSYEDLRRETISLISNALDLPEGVINEAKELLRTRTAELRDYVMKDVVPFVLSVNPALMSVRAMVPKMFDDAEAPDIEMETDRFQQYAQLLGIMATRMFLLDKMKLPEEMKSRLIQKLIPLAERKP